MEKDSTARVTAPSLTGRAGGGFLLFLLLLLTACTGKQQGPSPEQEARRDSAALHVSLMPVADCLPIYFAKKMGIYDSMGLDVRITTLQAQLDTDTALLHRRAEIAYSDLIRAIMMQQADTFGVVAVAATEGALELVTPRRGRVRSIPQLRERMVAVARHSITDYWSDRATDTAQMEADAIFRPQINDVAIRTAMLVNGTMDAAFLPEPYVTQMTLLGANRHLSTRNLSPRLAAYVVSRWVMDDTTRTRQLRQLFQGYGIASDRLNGAERDSLPALLRDICALPDSIADSVSTAMPPFAALDTIRRADAQEALKWLQGRGRARKDYTADTLVNNTIIKP